MQRNVICLFAWTIICFSTCIGSEQELKACDQRESVDQNEVETWYLRTTDQKCHLYVHEVGTGDPVIVLHGGPGGGLNTMLDIGESLTDEFRFIFFDQRGAGLSFAQKEDISLAKNVEDLDQLRTAIGAEKVRLVAHSAGTMLAIEYLKRFPGKVSHLILVGALHPMNGSLDYFNEEELATFKSKEQEFKQFRERPAVMAEIKAAGLDAESLSAKQQARLRHLKMASANIYRIENWRDVRFHYVNGIAAHATQSSTNFQYDWTQLFKGHPAAITVINGQYDYVVGDKDCPVWKRFVTEKATNVDLVVMEKAGHIPWVDDADQFSNALKQALSR